MAATRVGRYLVLREIGSGGMGVTYLAYDESLDRKVVLKLVRGDFMDDTAQKRLEREAQALARLAHPNIVAVHEVGHHGERAFISMEFVSGSTVDAWLRAERRAWREIVSVFRQAGEGLKAAHAAGLIHRDIKPSNIIVGEDGRVRLLDFGLARFERQVGAGEPEGPLSGGDSGADRGVDEGAAAEDGPRSPPSDSESLTRPSMLVGTLAYMAPEYLAGDPADPQTDQFSLCVSLFEALHGVQPFSSGSPMARLHQMRSGRIAKVALDGDLPAWLHDVVTRGLAADPEDRWPSMGDLVAALAHDDDERGEPRRRRLALGVAVPALLAAALIVAVMAIRVASERAAQVCSGGPERVDRVWGRQQRLAVERAMRAIEVPYAGDTWDRTSAALDRYRAAWIDAYTDACEATVVRREQSAEVRDRRMQCLGRHLRSLRALVAELGHIDAAAMQKATSAAGALPLIRSCADPEYLSSRVAPPSDPALAARVEELEGPLARVAQLRELGRYDVGLGVAEDVHARASRLDYPPIEARARLELGMLELANAAYERAEHSLREAYFAARAGGDHDVALGAATQLVFLLAHLAPRLDEASEWGRHLQAEIPWASSDAKQANAINTLGVLALMQERPDEAIALTRRALALWEQALGPSHPRLSWALENLGTMHFVQGDYQQAARLHRRALEVKERAFGAEHPSVAYPWNNLGADLHRLGEYAQAEGAYRRALAIRERALGPEHPFVAASLIGLALVLLDDGDPAQARPLAERALSLLERHGDGASAELAEARFALARALMSTGEDPERALALARQARETLAALPALLSWIRPAEVDAWLGAHAPGRE